MQSSNESKNGTASPPGTVDSSFPVEVWRLPALAARAAILVTAIAGVVFAISTRSIYDELECTIAIVALALFFVLQYGLFMGVRIEGKPRVPRFGGLGKSGKFFDLWDGIEILQFFGDTVAWIGIALAATVGLIFLASILWSSVVLFAFIVYWLFYRAFRIALLKGARCKGNTWMSFKYSALYTLLYSGWLFAIVWLAEHRPWNW